MGVAKERIKHSQNLVAEFCATFKMGIAGRRGSSRSIERGIFERGARILGGMSLWWGTELDLGRRESFDHHHRAAAKRAMPKRAWLPNCVGFGRQDWCGLRWGHGKQLFAEGNK